MRPERVSIIIRACAVLHNIALLRKEPLHGHAEADDRPNLVCLHGPEDGKVIRDHYGGRELQIEKSAFLKKKFSFLF